MFATIRRIIAWVGPYKGRLWGGTICSILSIWCSAVPVMIAAQYLEAMFKGMTLEKSEILISLVSIIIFIALRSLFTYLKSHLQDGIGNDVAAYHRLKIGEILKRVSLGYFDHTKEGDILTALTSELSVLELNGMKMIDRVLNGYLNTLAILAFLAVLCWQAALIAVVGMLVSYILLELINRMSERSAKETHTTVERMSAAALEIIHGLSLIKVFGHKNSASKNFDQACADNRAINIKIVWNYTPVNSLHVLVLKLSVVGIIFVAIQQLSTSGMDLASFLVLLLYAFNLLTPIEGINDASHMLGVMNDAMDRIEEIEQASFIDEGAEDVDLKSYDLDVDHLTFSYGDKKALDDVSLSIPQGSSCALVGPSGSGKSTLVKLITRFYDPESGSITFGGHDITHMTCDSLLKNVSMVFQKVYLFNDTIKNNIRFAKPDATDAEVEDAARKACCYDFITELPQGYDTIVGEGGSRLSGGEKQRISIARAILKDAPVIILDEATASVDPENEQEIQGALSALTQGKTTITIAHRLATIENSDLIAVMDAGRIVEKGTHQELVRQEGIYRDFVSVRKAAETWSLSNN